jgi:RNA polymerase sigma-70 factor (ECF subfamily)
MSEGLKTVDDGFPDDAALVRAFQAGETAAFDRLVLRHQDRTVNLCYRLLGNYAEADDCAQEVFVKAYRSLNGFRSGSAFSTWLYRIAVNASLSWRRSLAFRFRQRSVSLSQPDDPESEERPREIGDETLSPRRQAERGEREKIIQQAIDSLPKSLRMVLVLREIEGLPYEEVAAATGYNLGTVKSKLFRARERMREKLKEQL